MSGFHEVRFPDNIAYGATGGPEFTTTVGATGSGHEKRNVNWAQARGRWDVASGLKKQAQIDELIAFFRARRGRAYGFRFKDWTDHRADGQLLGTGDGAQTQFQLVKHYPSGSVIEVRTITKPVAGTVQVYLDGIEQASGWSVDTTTGLVTFSTPPALGRRGHRRNAGAAETNDSDTWNADYGVVYHLKEEPVGTAPQAKGSTANAVRGTYDIAGATVEDNTLWGGRCILFYSGPGLLVADNSAIENADRITVEARAGRPGPSSAARTAATSSTTTAGASPGTCSGPTTGCSTTSRGCVSLI